MSFNDLAQRCVAQPHKILFYINIIHQFKFEMRCDNDDDDDFKGIYLNMLWREGLKLCYS